MGRGAELAALRNEPFGVIGPVSADRPLRVRVLLQHFERRLALRGSDTCDEIVPHLPVGRAHLRDQIERAVTSVVANIAEGAGEFSPKEKARFYRMARRSAIEVAAWLEVTARRQEAPEPLLTRALALLEEVVAMLVSLIKNADR